MSPATSRFSLGRALRAHTEGGIKGLGMESGVLNPEHEVWRSGLRGDSGRKERVEYHQ